MRLFNSHNSGNYRFPFAAALALTITVVAHAKCDEWMPIYDGPNGQVNALLVHNDTLIAAGLFESTGSTSATLNPLARFIARFDGQKWSDLAGGMSGGGVQALAIYNDQLIAGGSFTRAGGNAAYGIARYDGRQWHALGNGFISIDDNQPAAVYALAVFQGDLIAAGNFETPYLGGDPSDPSVDGPGARFIARYNGSSWSAISSDINAPVHALLVHNNTLIAGGENFIMSFDGETFQPYANGPQPIGLVRTLHVHHDQLFAGGEFVGPFGGTHHALLKTSAPGASKDGNHPASWQPAGNEINAASNQEDFDASGLLDVHAMLTYRNDLIVAGELQDSGPSVLRHNGEFWLPLGAPAGVGRALAVYNDSLTAAAAFAADDTTPAFVAQWTDCSVFLQGDVNGDGFVDVSDLLIVLAQFGVCPDTTQPCTADVWPPFGGDSVVDIEDLLLVIQNWS